ncbi:MAG: tetratricopeptide repeat protein [Ignavibacteria bacterium]|nr:tetratricopeptide repeat protein [Ignavibacteria bacterium]
MKNIPSGNVTFLFTDIEGSTKLSQEFPDTLQYALDKHHAILENAFESNNGHIFEIVGDGFCCAFQNADDAVNAAVIVQTNLANTKWDDASIKIRIGIHTGEAKWNGMQYLGYITLAKTARVMSASYGEQILISDDTYRLLNFIKDPKTQSNKSRDLNSPGIRNFDEISFRDLGERRLKDVLHPVRLFQIIFPGLREEFPPLKTLDARPNNLPFQISGFIGRKNELKQIKNLLFQSRLVTLTGMGGTGKSRLALETGADMIDDFANGVWFVELAGLLNKSFLVHAIIAAVGAQEVIKESPEDTLVSFLKDKETLIILDNCEHMVSESARISEKLLNSCSKLKIIATSREAMKCYGEVVYKVPSLSIPDKKKTLTTEELINCESVKLFYIRAVSHKQNFSINEKNAPVISEICFMLDGNPLAIELAASFIKVFSPEEILERLCDRFSLLISSKRTAFRRHQSLFEMIDWSYELLTEKEKTLIQRLSIFSGSWTIEAAESICSDNKINRSKIFVIINCLIDKSFIGTVESDTENHYSILQIIRHYGLKKLDESEDKSEIQKKYFEYYLKIAQEFDSKLIESADKYLLDIFEKDNDNFRQAIKLSMKSDPVMAIKIAIAMCNFWVMRGYYLEGFNTLKKVLKVCKGTEDNLRARLLSNAGYFACEQGEFRIAELFLNKSLKLYKKANNETDTAATLITLGLLNFYTNEFDKAKKLYEKALSISRSSNSRKEQVNSLVNLGIIELKNKNYDESVKLFQESLVLSRKLKDKYTTARILTNLASIEHFNSNFKKADLFYEESLNILRKLGDNQGIAHILANLGNNAFKMKDFEKSKTLNEECLIISRKYGYKNTLMISIMRLAELSRINNDLKSAIKYYTEYLKLYKTSGDKNNLALCLYELGKISITQGNHRKAVKLLFASENLFNADGFKPDDIRNRKYEEHYKKIKEIIGDDVFDYDYEYVKHLTFDEIIEFAAEDDES